MSAHQEQTPGASRLPSYRVKLPIYEAPRGQSFQPVFVRGMAKTVKAIKAMRKHTIERGSMLYNIPRVNHSDSLVDMIVKMKDISQSVNQEGSTASICGRSTASLTSFPNL